MIDAAALQSLLTVLHGAGYRLRSIGADSLTVADGLPVFPIEAAPAEQRDGPTLEEQEAEQDKWAHVGGRPPFLREPKPREANPWADTHPERS